MAIPPETPRPWSAKLGTALFALAEAIADERDDRLHGLGLVRAAGLERDLRALARGQHHDAHDALRVDFPVVARQRDIALVFRRELRELRRGARVETQFVDYLNFALRHTPDPRSCAERRRSRRTPPASPSSPYRDCG